MQDGGLIVGSRWCSRAPAPDEGKINKRICLEVSDATLAQRAADVLLYVSELERIGCALPETQVRTGIEDQKRIILITQEKLFGLPGLVALAHAQDSEVELIVGSCIQAALPIMKSMNTARPLGYDSGLDNFIYNPQSGQSFLCDVFPPRLGFKLDSQGSARPVPGEQLLVDYAEAGVKSRAEQEPYRHFYYTPEGTIEHMLAWFISARFALERFPPAWRDIANTREVNEIVSASLECFAQAGFQNTAINTKQCLKADRWEHYVDHRLSRANIRYHMAGLRT